MAAARMALLRAFVALCTFGVALVVGVAAPIVVVFLDAPKIIFLSSHCLLLFAGLLVLLLVLFVDARVLHWHFVSIAMPRRVFRWLVVPTSCWCRHRVVVIMRVVVDVILVVQGGVFLPFVVAIRLRLSSGSVDLERHQ